jgi:hypothetical protein
MALEPPMHYNCERPRHEPGRMRPRRGRFLVFGRTQSMSTLHTLFHPDGDPPHAKVTLGVVRELSMNEETLTSNRWSPDLRHNGRVGNGDALPLPCPSVHGDGRRCMVGARFNGPPDCRRLQPGTRLRFAPLA